MLSKLNIFLIVIILIGICLRLYQINEYIPLIGDQGWFYLSARDAILTGNIPLVGIETSRVWLSQGAFWTYILIPIFLIFKFNPIAPAVFTALLDVLTILVIFKLAKDLFNEKIALIASLFYATSPAMVIDARMPYHTAPIGFLTALYLYVSYKWINGKVIYFPISIFMLGILYNFEIATFSLGGITAVFFAYGLIKKKKFVLDIFTKKMLGLSLIGLIIPLIPFIIFDLKTGLFAQTIKVIVWIGYRTALFFGYPPINPNAPGETWATFATFSKMIVNRIFFLENFEIALIIFISIVVIPLFLIIRNFFDKKNNINLNFIFLSFLVPTIAYVVAKTNSAAYILKIYPQIAILIGFVFAYSYKNKIVSFFAVCFIIAVCLTNAYSMVTNNYYYGVRFAERYEIVDYIKNQSNGQKFNIIGEGEGNHYKSFMMGFEYLLWWKGIPPSKEDQKIKFYIHEYIDRIDIRKEIK